MWKLLQFIGKQLAKLMSKICLGTTFYVIQKQCNNRSFTKNASLKKMNLSRVKQICNHKGTKFTGVNRSEKNEKVAKAWAF